MTNEEFKQIKTGDLVLVQSIGKQWIHYVPELKEAVGHILRITDKYDDEYGDTRLYLSRSKQDLSYKSSEKWWYPINSLVRVSYTKC